ncbi:MAG: hypothetical protein ACKOCV_09315, partial [Gemmatimonadota bacterium]
MIALGSATGAAGIAAISSNRTLSASSDSSDTPSKATSAPTLGTVDERNASSLGTEGRFRDTETPSIRSTVAAAASETRDAQRARPTIRGDVPAPP